MTIDKVAVIVSPGFGAGWSTGGDPKSALDQTLAAAIEAERSAEEISEIADRNWPGQHQGGLSDATVVWMQRGQAFYIQERDGHESIVTVDDCQTAIENYGYEVESYEL